MILGVIFFNIVFKDPEIVSERSHDIPFIGKFDWLTFDVESILNNFESFFDFTHKLKVESFTEEVIDFALLELTEGHVAHD